MKLATPLVLLVGTALLSGCGDPLSNQLFFEDVLFVEAVPERDDVRTEHPGSRGLDGLLQDEDDADGSAARGEEATALFPPAAREEASTINQRVFSYLELLDDLMAEPIVTRSQDERVWGPYSQASTGGSRLLVVRRDAEQPEFFDYTLSFTGDPVEEVDEGTVWEDFLVGEFRRDSETVSRSGAGRFEVDRSAHPGSPGEAGAGGLMRVEHRRAAGITLWVDFVGWTDGEQPPGDLHYFFSRSPNGGVLEYEGNWQLVGDEESPQERISTRIRWEARAGRADFHVWAGDIVNGPVEGSECWDVDLFQTWFLLGGQPEEGSEDSCVLPDRQELQEVVSSLDEE